MVRGGIGPGLVHSRSHIQRQQLLPAQRQACVAQAAPAQRTYGQHVSRGNCRGLVPQAAAVASAPPTEPPAAAEDTVPRGETAGAVMIMDDVTLQAGERDLLIDSDWRLMPGHRVGLVGANGAGKSTLLKAIAGLRGIDTGRLLVSPNVSVGYLAQTAVSGSTKTVYEEARGAMAALVAAEAAMEAAAAAAEAGEVRAAEMLSEAQDAFEAAGGYDADRRIGVVLDGLGFR